VMAVVVTGVGALCALGDEAALSPAMLHGLSGIAEVGGWSAAMFPVGLAAAVRGEVPSEPGHPDDRAVALWMRAAAPLLAEPELVPAGRRGVFVGVGLASMTPRELAEDVYPHIRGGRVDRALQAMDRSADRVAPRRRRPERCAALLAHRWGATGAELTSFSACAASAEAIAAGARAVARGDVDVALVGGCDAMIHPMGMASFEALGALGREPARPFDRRRAGFTIGEGAAVLRLERAGGSRRPLAELLGAGSSCDAHGVTAPQPDGRGAEVSMRAALVDAGLAPADIAWVKAHATGTPVGDAAEARAIHRLFGERTPVASLKGALGHALAASGALELVAAIRALEGGFIPGTVGCQHVDALGIDVCLTPRPAAGRTALCNSFGFGGQNVSMVVGVPR
jgi:3-oxoacyl-[acyl-carrier-protein] synthase II